MIYGTKAPKLRRCHPHWRDVRLVNIVRTVLEWCNYHTRTVVVFALLLGATGSAFGIDAGRYSWLFALLLGVGLLSSTFGIDLSEMRSHDWRTLIWAVTVGVTLKAALIGSVMYGLSGGDMQFFVVAITVAQMDPLSVAALTDKAGLSPRADNLLRAWAALDDPVTVLLTVIAFVVMQITHVDIGLSFSSIQVTSLGGFGTYAIQNVAFMATIVFLWQHLYAKLHIASYTYKLTLTLTFMAGGIVIGSTWFWMFGVALVGIFLRPDDTTVTAKVRHILEIATNIAFAVAGIVVGILLLTHGFNLLQGVALGASAFGSQIIVVQFLPARHQMSRRDRLYLAGGHQNGVTACLLALATDTVDIVAVGIVTTHILNFAWNTTLKHHYAKAERTQSHPCTAAPYYPRADPEKKSVGKYHFLL